MQIQSSCSADSTIEYMLNIVMYFSLSLQMLIKIEQRTIYIYIKSSGATTFFEVEGQEMKFGRRPKNFLAALPLGGQISVFAPPIGGCKILQI